MYGTAEIMYTVDKIRTRFQDLRAKFKKTTALPVNGVEAADVAARHRLDDHRLLLLLAHGDRGAPAVGNLGSEHTWGENMSDSVTPPSGRGRLSFSPQPDHQYKPALRLTGCTEDVIGKHV